MRLSIILKTTRLEIPRREVTKEVVGFGVPMTRSLSGDGIPRKLLLLVSPAKPTYAPLRSNFHWNLERSPIKRIPWSEGTSYEDRHEANVFVFRGNVSSNLPMRLLRL
jgi:hypothetical protein